MVLKKGDGSCITVEQSEAKMRNDITLLMAEKDTIAKIKLYPLMTPPNGLCFTLVPSKVHSNEKLYVLKTFGKLYVENIKWGFWDNCTL